LLLSFSGCLGSISGSAEIRTQEFAFDDFSRIEVGHAFEVDISRSDSYLVIITANDNLYDYLDISKLGDTLRIQMKRNYLYTNTTLRATITLPALDRLELSGASSGTLNGFSSSQPMDFEISGASHLDIIAVAAGDTRFEVSGASKVSGSMYIADGDFDISGASTLELSGSADDIFLDVSGASHARLASFPVADADIDASGASHATINASGRLDADISGASHLTYLGSPSLGRINTSGASTISQG